MAHIVPHRKADESIIRDGSFIFIGKRRCEANFRACVRIYKGGVALPNAISYLRLASKTQDTHLARRYIKGGERANSSR